MLLTISNAKDSHTLGFFLSTFRIHVNDNLIFIFGQAYLILNFCLLRKTKKLPTHSRPEVFLIAYASISEKSLLDYSTTC